MPDNINKVMITNATNNLNNNTIVSNIIIFVGDNVISQNFSLYRSEKTWHAALESISTAPNISEYTI